MPVYNSFSFEQSGPGQPLQPSPRGLAANGPNIRVQIEVAAALAQSFQETNQAIPTPVVGVALIDTGASITAIDGSVVTQLGLNPNGVAMVGTAGGPQQQSTFQARFSFPGTPLLGFEHARVLGCDLAGQTVLNQQPIVALIGRDILSRCVLVYNGSAGVFSLSM
jgi:hypothetical protein